MHISGIEREFTSQITDDEAATLARVFARLLSRAMPDRARRGNGPHRFARSTTVG